MEDIYRTHGAFKWHELATNDIVAAKPYYNDLSGRELRDEPMEGMTDTLMRAG